MLDTGLVQNVEKEREFEKQLQEDLKLDVGKGFSRLDVEHKACACSVGHKWWQKGREGRVANLPDQNFRHPIDPHLYTIQQGEGEKEYPSRAHVVIVVDSKALYEGQASIVQKGGGAPPEPIYRRRKGALAPNNTGQIQGALPRGFFSRKEESKGNFCVFE